MAPLTLAQLKQDSIIERPYPPITCEWLANRSILSFTNTDNTRAGVDLTGIVIQEIFGNWPAEKPLLVIINAQHNQAMLTPYARHKLQETFQNNENVKGRTAILIQNNVVGQLIRLFMKARATTQQRERRIFFKQDDALLWLAEMLES